MSVEPNTWVAAESQRASWRLIALLLGLGAGTLIVDQLSKSVVVATMTQHEQITVINDFLLLIFVRNPGAAFGMVGGQTWIFSILAIVVTCVIIWALRRIRSRSWAVVFGLLLGGTLGNLTDRLFREPGFGFGQVVDFINVPWLMPAIFNVADIAISAAAVMFIVLVLLGVNLDGSRKKIKSSLSSEAGIGNA